MTTCEFPTLTAIVKPTYACNLGCLYCYEGGRSGPCQRMNLNTLRNVITKLAQYHGPERMTHIIWHGGEPLLMGLDFFQAAVQFQQNLGPEYRFENAIQTNGTLLSDEVLDFFQEHDFSVGTSLDGPQWLHDFTRPYGDGHSSFADILHNVNRLRQRNAKDSNHSIGGGVIAVLTKPVLPHLDEFYEFFRENRINLKINPIFYAGHGATVQEKLGITAVEYGDAMIHLFDRWFYEPEQAIEIDPFDLILGNLMTGEAWGCQFGPACHDKFIAVDPHGNVYPCGRWSGDDPFCLGNLNEQDLFEIRCSPVLEEFRLGRARAWLTCQGCGFRAICNSGCVENGYLLRQRLSDRDIYCAGYRTLFAHISGALETELEAASVVPGQDRNDQTVVIGERMINMEAVSLPALQQVIHRRLDLEERPTWNDSTHDKWRKTYTDHVRHEKYERHDRYFDHRQHLKYKERYDDHSKWTDAAYKKGLFWRDYSDHRDYYSDHGMC